MNLPSFEKCKESVDLLNYDYLNPIEKFIYDNEPAIKYEEWRESVKLMFDYAKENY